MPEMHDARRQRVQAKLAALGADAALVTHLPNVRYLTGLASSNAALLLPASGEATLATDSRYMLAAERDCADLELVIDRFLEPVLGHLAVQRKYRKLLCETQEMTVARYHLLAREAEGVGLAPFGNTVEELRTVKDEAELDLLTQACRISCQAIEDVLPQIRAGMTERELATVIERRMVDLGAEKPAFDTIVASGPNGAIPHHVPGERALRRGDLVTIDFGARYGGYHADMTRTVSIGEPEQWQRDTYDLVARAQQAGIDAATAGTQTAVVDAAARDVIGQAGHAEHFKHGIGHGVGLEVHEAPMLGYGRTGTLAPRVPVTIEPGVYLPGKGGVRIEDIIVVGAGGGFGDQADSVPSESAGLLTTTTRELLAL